MPLTDTQLEAMAKSAPLLVQEVRILRVHLEEARNRLNAEAQAHLSTMLELERTQKVLDETYIQLANLKQTLRQLGATG